jgi:aspartokinase-like uncharacterized kinase
MWVVKLGGSLFGSEHLNNWLSVLAKVGPLVVVPGGGPFADQVRQAQQRWGFDDSTAHIMALLAMEQFGHLLCGLQAGLTGAASRAQIEEVLERGEVAVWLPASMVMADPGVEHSWEVTSDSLAAWLTGQLGADKLLLVKSLSLGAEGLPLETLVEREVIDARFGSYLQQPDIQAWTMAGGDHGRFEEVFQGNMAAATRILCQDTG